MSPDIDLSRFKGQSPKVPDQNVQQTQMTCIKQLHLHQLIHVTQIVTSKKSKSMDWFLYDNGPSVLHSRSIKNIFYDKMDLRLFYFHEAKYSPLIPMISRHQRALK